METSLDWVRWQLRGFCKRRQQAAFTPDEAHAYEELLRLEAELLA